MNSNSKDINILCKIVSESFGLAVFFISSEGDVVFEHLNNQSLNPLYKNDKNSFFKAINFEPENKENFPVIRKTDFLEKYLTISYFNQANFEGTVLVGPFVSYLISEERINSIINETRLFSNRDKIFNYYKSLPNIKNEKLIHISVIVYQLFNDKILNPDMVRNKNLSLIGSNEKVDETKDRKSV